MNRRTPKTLPKTQHVSRRECKARLPPLLPLSITTVAFLRRRSTTRVGNTLATVKTAASTIKLNMQCHHERSHHCHNFSWTKSSQRRFAVWITLSLALQSQHVNSFTASSGNVRMRRRNQPLRRMGVSLFSEDNGPVSPTKTPKKELQTDALIDVPKGNLSWNESRKAMSLGRMSSFGGLFSIGVVVLLALNNDPSDSGIISEANPNLDFVEGQVGAVITNVMNAALPKSATDVISVSLGEGIAGAIGAIATVAVTALLQIPKTNMEMEQRSLVEEAVADGDYFFTRAAALPLLEAAGLPRFAATLASVAVALVPYEIIKNRYKQQREKVLASADEIKNTKQKQRTIQKPDVLEIVEPPMEIASEVLVEKSEGPQQLDLVELFSDITKWLEYDVLKRDLNGKLFLGGQVLNPGLEGALFGFLAALSSKLYADVLYQYFGFGPKSKQKELRERSLTASLSLYTAESLSAASLFGVYESVRFPVSEAITALLSGGVDSCLGSDDFSLCIEVFMMSNPPEATWEGQIRSLLTALFSLWNRFESEATVDVTDEIVRALAVQFYSVANNLLGLELVY